VATESGQRALFVAVVVATLTFWGGRRCHFGLRGVSFGLLLD
jgi:hypothetical protein